MRFSGANRGERPAAAPATGQQTDSPPVPQPTGRAAPGLPSAKRNLGILLIAVFGIVFAVAGLRIWGQVERATGSDGFTWGLLFAFIPVLPLTALYLWLDRYEPEPTRLILFAFCWGAFIATLAALFLNQVGADLLGERGGGGFRSAVFIAPPVEELAKGSLILLLAIARRRDFDGIIDALVYAGMVGIGFAFTENILYYGRIFAALADQEGAQSGLSAVYQLFIIRGIVSPFAHPLFTSFTAVGIGIAVRHRSSYIRIFAPLVGYSCAVLAHALWNGAVSLASGSFLYIYLFLMVPIFVGMVVFALVMRARESQMIAARMYDYVRFGWLQPQEVPVMSTMKGRRAMRKAAKRFGPDAQADSLAFLRTATELAYLRDKMVRQVVGPKAADNEKQLLDELRRRRPGVVLPRMHAFPVPPPHDTGAGGHGPYGSYGPYGPYGSGPSGSQAGSPRMPQAGYRQTPH